MEFNEPCLVWFIKVLWTFYMIRLVGGPSVRRG